MRRARLAALGWLAALVVVLPLVSARADPPPADSTTQVVVKGSRVRPRVPPKDRNVAGTLLQGHKIQGAGKQVAEILRAEPGVAVVESGGQGALATASIRGATSAQTPVYLAGVRLNDDVAGSADLSLVPLWIIQRIEVYRGNAPIEADQLGIGGAIFFEPVRPRKPGIGAGAQVGSFGTHGVWAWGSQGDDRAGALVGIRLDHAQNNYPYVDDRGTRFDPNDDVTRSRSNADADTIDVWGVGTAMPGRDARIDMVLNGVEREQGIPGLALIPSQAARFRTRRWLAAVSASAPCRDDDTCMLHATSSVIEGSTQTVDPLRELALGATTVSLVGRRVDQSAHVRIDVDDRLTLTPSLRGSVERLLVDSDGASSLRASRAGARSALGAEWRISKAWSVRGLGTAECQGTSLGGLDLCSSVAPAGRTGVGLSVGPVTFLGNVGRYVRQPTLAELYGLTGTVRGNTSLSAEHGSTFDLGARVVWKGNSLFQGAYVDTFAFLRTASDLIAWRRATTGYVRPYNVASARVGGIEVLAGAGLAGFVDLEVAATLLDPRDSSERRTEQNDFLPFRSRLVASPSMRLYSHAWVQSGIDEVAFVTRYTYQSSRYADSAGLVVIPAQGALDLEASLVVLEDHLALRLRLADALDQPRFDTIGYPLPRRAWYGAGELRW
jgi:vitamin B12 transporter